VDAEDGVIVIGWAAQHAIELGPAEALVERVDLLSAVGHRRVVALGGAELEVLREIVDLLAELLREIERRLDLGALAEDLLSALLIVPEPLRKGDLVQVFELSSQVRDVKNAPLAPQSAF
jgi:hypothetical protein